jgi:hypothetical protein
MKFAALARDLALIRTPERQAELARLSRAQLERLPEATLVKVVHGWFELKSDGHSDADILREIEGRRAKEYGEEPLPGDLTLESYARYRLRLEHPQETNAHDAIFVMQAVHRASQVIGATYREETEGASARGPRVGAMAVLAYAAFIAIGQGLPGMVFLLAGSTRMPGWVAATGLAVAVTLLLGAIGYAGGTFWGRRVALAALWSELALLAIATVVATLHMPPPLSAYLLPAVPAAGAVASLYYLRRRHREFAGLSPA